MQNKSYNKEQSHEIQSWGDVMQASYVFSYVRSAQYYVSKQQVRKASTTTMLTANYWTFDESMDPT